MKNSTAIVYTSSDPNVVNAVIFMPNVNEFVYVPLDRLDSTLADLKKGGFLIKEEVIKPGESVTIPLSSAPKDYPDKDYADQEVAATISTTPFRGYTEKDMPKEFVEEGVTPEQYAKLVGKKELVVDVHEKRLLKSPAKPSRSSNKDPFIEVRKTKENEGWPVIPEKPKRNNKDKVKDYEIDVPFPIHDTPRPDIRSQQGGRQL